MARWIFFTDLDGTLLDHYTYSWQPAHPALRQLRLRGCPLVVCTSKTRAEVIPLREELSLTDPFVAENGGALYIPRNYFPFALPTALVESGFQVLELGQRYPKLVQALEEAAETSGVCVRGFSQMSDKEVAQHCHLTRAAAKRARQREYDEPFLIEKGTPRQKERFFRWLQQRGLRWREGSRFLHLMGDNDKGVAVAKLVELYRQLYTEVRTVGLGDSPNDLDFLQVVDLPVLVQKFDSSYDERVRQKLRHARLARGAGPVGWNETVLAILHEAA
ncbi:MAG: HAD-IIB family hydrolase [Acidobacteria bacterium]|nr:HAD-IIB family hydrolase [Acidobacteriota bacterium]